MERNEESQEGRKENEEKNEMRVKKDEDRVRLTMQKAASLSSVLWSSE